MSKLVVSEFVSLDRVMEDPGGGESFERGGWAFKFERSADGDRFKYEEPMDAAGVPRRTCAWSRTQPTAVPAAGRAATGTPSSSPSCIASASPGSDLANHRPTSTNAEATSSACLSASICDSL
jgi:hypothetical protein